MTCVLWASVIVKLIVTGCTTCYDINLTNYTFSFGEILYIYMDTTLKAYEVEDYIIYFVITFKSDEVHSI